MKGAFHLIGLVLGPEHELPCTVTIDRRTLIPPYLEECANELAIHPLIGLPKRLLADIGDRLAISCTYVAEHINIPGIPSPKFVDFNVLSSTSQGGAHETNAGESISLGISQLKLITSELKRLLKLLHRLKCLITELHNSKVSVPRHNNKNHISTSTYKRELDSITLEQSTSTYCCGLRNLTRSEDDEEYDFKMEWNKLESAYPNIKFSYSMRGGTLVLVRAELSQYILVFEMGIHTEAGEDSQETCTIVKVHVMGSSERHLQASFSTHSEDKNLFHFNFVSGWQSRSSVRAYQDMESLCNSFLNEVRKSKFNEITSVLLIIEMLFEFTRSNIS